MDIILGIIGIIVIACFFVLVYNIAKIKAVIIGLSREMGYGFKYTCDKCNTKYLGKQDFCPFCGDVKIYSKSLFYCKCDSLLEGKPEKCPHCNRKINYPVTK